MIMKRKVCEKGRFTALSTYLDYLCYTFLATLEVVCRIVGIGCGIRVKLLYFVFCEHSVGSGGEKYEVTSGKSMVSNVTFLGT